MSSIMRERERESWWHNWMGNKEYGRRDSREVFVFGWTKLIIKVVLDCVNG